MTYEEALSYIHSISWKGSVPGLSRISELMQKLGNVQNKLKIVHVAGTNGKGSTCAMLESILRTAGYRTGLYISPFIERFNERMCVGGEPIPDDTLAEITDYVKGYADEMADAPTEFELITAIAFEYFYRSNCDVVVLETGMGGRLDCTNVIDTAEVSVITGIALDHVAFLGNTFEKIAAEKAGIIKTGVPVIWGGTHAGAGAVIAAKAREMDAPLHTPDYRRLSTESCSLEEGIRFSYKNRDVLTVQLRGSYQPHNAAIVLETVDCLRSCGWCIPEEAVRVGLAGTRWKARFELLSKDPIAVYDGGHNMEGVTAAAESIRLYFPSQKVVLLTGVMEDKAYRDMASTLAPLTAAAITVTPDNPRSLPAPRYAEVFRALGVFAEAADTIPEGVAKAVALAKEQGRPLIMLGSLYMYGDVKAALLQIV
ncbi:MAG: bifunctional folylpolyglutamate synthase/dihydrofolate synthase [Clostridia bacterium]|nr:bifunctional folylpolyglutamate synthase/dihydrofolate synthase [Clostridia bacterium]